MSILLKICFTLATVVAITGLITEIVGAILNLDTIVRIGFLTGISGIGLAMLLLVVVALVFVWRDEL